jgi:hypothetical protein
VLLKVGVKHENHSNRCKRESISKDGEKVAFAHCGELNLFGIVDAQIAAIERELWAE